MKLDLLAAAFAALFTALSYAHPPGPEALQLKLSLDIAEPAKEPTWAVLVFDGALLCPQGDHYTIRTKVDGSEFHIHEPGIEVGNICLHGYANCTVFTDDVPPKEYDIVNFGLPEVCEKIDPPAVFGHGNCTYPKHGEDVVKLGL